MKLASAMGPRPTKPPRRSSRTVYGLLAAVLVAVAWPALVHASEHPVIDSAFWDHWGDGQAELAGYELLYPRYGETRLGRAVAIFVTETFSHDLRVKADPGRHDESDTYPVMKLNLVQDFQTGIYDYNMMTSVFVALADHKNLRVGDASKISFSSQEWCGQVYHQLVPQEDGIQERLHSYFDGEADRSRTLEARQDGLSEDALLLWARGLAGPVLAAGETTDVPLLMSLERARVRHQPVSWTSARLRRAEHGTLLTVPAGMFQVQTLEASVENGPTYLFHVEDEHPHRIVSWENDQGVRAVLLGTERLRYWQLNAEGGERFLESLGLQ